MIAEDDPLDIFWFHDVAVDRQILECPTALERGVHRENALIGRIHACPDIHIAGDGNLAAIRGFWSVAAPYADIADECVQILLGFIGKIGPQIILEFWRRVNGVFAAAATAAIQ